MEYSYLGNSGLQVSRIGLGIMTFHQQVDEEKAYELLKV